MFDEITERLRTRLNELTKGKWKTTVRMIDIDLIYPNPYHAPQPIDHTEITQLIQKFNAEGIRAPITVSAVGSVENPQFQLISGEKTYHACVYGKISPVPCIILDSNTSSIGDVSFSRKTNTKHEISHNISYNTSQNSRFRNAFSQENLTLLKIDTENQKMFFQVNLSQESILAIESLPPRIKQEIYHSIQNSISAQNSKIEHANSEKNHQKTLSCIKDTRFFFNSVSKAVKTMNESGIAVEYSREEQPTATKLTILVPKHPPNTECSTWNTTEKTK